MKRSSNEPQEESSAMEGPSGKRPRFTGHFEGGEPSSTTAGPSGNCPKFIRGEDDFLAGSIIEMELSNFMTYDHIRCKPSPRLNLVVGPNGSGKSSIVCGIALGLGGEPQQLGRASSIGAYVKRGEESGYIKMYLKTENEGLVTITRKIDTHNKSEWLLNGKSVPKKDAIEIIRSFNIQVDNLTQFLPQDRVCEFAKLTPVQLLEETEKAVGDPRLPIQHRALVEKSNELKKIDRAIKKMQDSLNQLKALDAEQEKDVERVRQRDELLAKVESMKKKLPWLRYDMKKAKYMEAKELEKEAKKKFDEAAKTLNDLREPIDKQKQDKVLFASKSKKLNGMINDNANRRTELLENENRLAVQVQGKYSEMGQLRKQEESRQQRILKAKEDLAAVELELENLPHFETPKAELERLATQILEIGVLVNQKRAHKDEKEKLLAQKKGSLRQCQDRLKDMENTNNKRLQALRNSGADKIFDAYKWLQNHQHELNKEVYGPVLLEVNVSNRTHADYLEGHLPYYIWKSFITQDPGDRDFLVTNLKSCDVPILNYMGDSHHNKSFQISEEMHALGIHSRLDQVFDAPGAVKEVLNNQFGLDHSYIGSKDSDQKADAVANLGILDFWTPENHYRWTTSRYGSHISGSVEAVDRSRLLFCNLDVGEIERVRMSKTELEETIVALEENVRLLQSEQRHLEDEAAKLQKQREEIINNVQLQKRKRQDMENRLSQRKRRVESFENEDDVDTVLAKLIEQVGKCNIQRFHCVIKIKNLLVEAVSYKKSIAENHMASIEFDVKIRELENDFKQYEKFALEMSRNFEHCKKEGESCREQLLAAKRYAESVAVITPELKEAFLKMPTTVEDLEAAIQDNIDEANSIFFLNQNILEEYEDRQRQIQSISKKLEADKLAMERCLAEIEALKGSWLPTLRNLVGKINETFSHNFQEMAVAGEVSLDEHDTDFDQYGILVKVKFRQAGQLQVLSAHHQSGGERSVSTILYLVSLQDLTNCPFRVVDEINQGMDPINERKMFQQLVRAASQPNTPQCFLLTPKLLPDLEYSESCSILNIMNGPWIEQPSKLWSKGESWGSVMGFVQESRC